MNKKNILFIALLTLGFILVLNTITIGTADAASYYKKGSSGKDVKNLQTDLKKAGFKVVDQPTTYFGTETEKQVKAFQKKHGLTADGIAGQATLKKLEDVIQKKSSPSPHSSNLSYYKLGMSDAGVKKLQQDLAKAKFKVVDKPTNYFGKQTEKQVKAFQKTFGLTTDGIAGQATLKKLNEVISKKQSPSSSSKTPTYYTPGMTHSGVKKLQQDLAKAGFKVTDKPTTYFGPATQKQVRAFQKKYNLLVDGIAGEATLKKLDSAVNQKSDTKPSPNKTKYYKKGMTDSHIKKLQQDLEKAGFKVVDKPTTYFGIQTEKQVKAFQKKYGLTADGIAGIQTLNKLSDVIKTGAKPHEGASSESQTDYRLTLNKALNIQMGQSPQTDQSIGWVSKKYINNNKVTANALNVRNGPSTNWSNIGSLKKGAQVKVLDEFKGWYAINFNSYGWKHGSPKNVKHHLNPNNNSKYQHIRLNTSINVPKAQLNKVLNNKGTLTGTGQAFIDAANKYNVNEAYLISHAFLETGNGRSTLAQGVTYNGKTVYNMFGIGAIDSNPLGGGAKTAYENKWFTPSQAIIGGAKWIQGEYINNSFKQNTIYKMRWNPQMADGNAWKQYATDIGWASKQTPRIEAIYNQISNPDLYFDYPSYK